MIAIFERNEMTECPRKPWQTTSRGITRHIQPFSTHSARSMSYQCFFRSRASSRFSSQETLNSMRKILFFELNYAIMSGRFSVRIIWAGYFWDVLRSTETFQSLFPFSSFVLDFFSSQGIHLPCETELWVPWM